MRSYFVLITLLFFNSGQAKTQIYELNHGQLIPTKSLQKTTNITVETLKVVVRIKKFTVHKKQTGVSVSFQPVCEFPLTIPVQDLTSGGLISENVYGHCPSTKDGIPVSVILSGMVYDSIGATFSDEAAHIRRNFFTHLYLESSQYIFDLGDFNLGTTNSFPFKHWMSELSTDSQGGRERGKRQGFVAAVRYSL